jgi:hypothetical protein
MLTAAPGPASRIVFVRVLVWVCVVSAAMVGKVNIFHGPALAIKVSGLRIRPLAAWLRAKLGMRIGGVGFRFTAWLPWELAVWERAAGFNALALRDGWKERRTRIGRIGVLSRPACKEPRLIAAVSTACLCSQSRPLDASLPLWAISAGRDWEAISLGTRHGVSTSEESHALSPQRSRLHSCLCRGA